MKGLLVAAALAIASVVALNSGSDNPAHSQDSQLQQGIDRMDNMLQSGLSQQTHDQIAATAKRSATWLEGFGESVKSATE